MKPIKVKIFMDSTWSINSSNQLRINKWLEENPDIDIENILQSESMIQHSETKFELNLTISIFYR